LIHTHELLSGIKKLSFLYDLREGATWKKVRSWDSDVDSQTAAFPDVIEINLEVVSQKNLSFEGRYKFRREIPIHGLPGTF
jgi:hypothetical protein